MKNILQELPWRRLWKVGRPFWTSDQKWNAYLHLFAVLALMGGNIGLQVYVTYTQGKVARSIQHWEMSNIIFYLLMSIGLILLQVPVQATTAMLRTRLALMWRRWLSTSFFRRWYDVCSKPYFWITTRRRDVANPDQRMTQDPDSFANSTIGLLTAFLEAGAQIITWAGVLITLSYVLTGTAILCAVISSTVVALIGKGLIPLTNQQMDTEAELRVSAGRARDGAEAIAFGHGEKVAEQQAVTRVGRVIDTLLSIMKVNRNIQLFRTGWDLLMPLVPPAVLVYMSPGPIDYELIVRAGGAFIAFYNASNIFANQFGGLASYFAIINRLGVFVEAIEWAGEDPQPGKHIDIKVGDDIVFDGVTILDPGSTKVLLSNVSFKLEKGDNVLVCSSIPEAQGKTSLLKTIAGILDNGSGSIERPPSNEVMFLTPSPDLPLGTLRQALSYPSIDECPDDARLHQILSLVNLAPVAVRIGGLDTEQNWRESLSKTEQQRLVLARILMNKPRYVIIDETGLDEENERMLYSLLAAMEARVISAGNSGTLLRFHNKVLEIAPDGTCNFFPASEYKPTPAPATEQIVATAKARVRALNPELATTNSSSRT